MRYLLLLFASLCFIFSNSQDFKSNLKIWAELPDLSKDSVIIGINSSATDSIDAAFDELNIMDQAWKEFEVRLISRKEPLSVCQSFSGNYYNYDTKVDYRDISSYWPPVISYLLQVKSASYPIKFYCNPINFLDESGMSESLISTTCTSFKKDAFLPNVASNTRNNDDSLLFILDEGDEFIEITLAYRFVNTNRVNSQELSIMYMPDRSQLTIKGLSVLGQTVTVFSLDGKVVLESILKTNSINTSDLKNGIYILRIQSAEMSFSEKFIIPK